MRVRLCWRGGSPGTVSQVFTDVRCWVNTAAVEKVTERTTTQLSQSNVVMLVLSAAYSTAARITSVSP